jgi:hypothetical protein
MEEIVYVLDKDIAARPEIECVRWREWAFGVSSLWIAMLRQTQMTIKRKFYLVIVAHLQVDTSNVSV